jgi:hypothetical protein
MTSIYISDELASRYLPLAAAEGLALGDYIENLLAGHIDMTMAPDVEAAWASEIDRRSAAMDAGAAQFVSWQAVQADAHKHLNS